MSHIKIGLVQTSCVADKDIVFQIYNRNETDQAFTPPIPIYDIKKL
jgi:hypothetical protein